MKTVSIVLLFSMVFLAFDKQDCIIHTSIVPGNKISFQWKSTPVCPFCHRDSEVIMKAQDTNAITHIQFKNKHAEKKYFKTKDKLGYATDWETIWPDLINEKEVFRGRIG